MARPQGRPWSRTSTGPLGTPRKLTDVAGSASSARGMRAKAGAWESDGTAAGTDLVKDINPGPGSSGPGSLTNADGTLYLSATDRTHGQRALEGRPLGLRRLGRGGGASPV